MTHLPRTIDEIPESIADLPPMSVDDARNMDRDVLSAMFGNTNPSIAPAWAAIERQEREKKWAKRRRPRNKSGKCRRSSRFKAILTTISTGLNGAAKTPNASPT